MVYSSHVPSKLTHSTYVDVPTVMLDRQYRMHPSISKFPSKEFYNTRLLDGTVDRDGHISATLLPPKSTHLTKDAVTGHFPSAIFLDHGGLESRRNRSLVNHNEGAIVCSIVEDLLLNNPVSGIRPEMFS